MNLQEKRLKMYEEILPDLLNIIKVKDKRTAVFLQNHMNELDPVHAQFEGKYIYGSAGTGKTVYAVWSMLAWIRYNYMNGHAKRKVEFVPVPQFIDTLKAEIGKNDNKIHLMTEALIEADIVVFDDIGIIRATDWIYQLMYTIIDARYKKMKTCIYTNNMSLTEFADTLNDDRIPSRIAHQCGDNVLIFKNNKRNEGIKFPNQSFE